MSRNVLMIGGAAALVLLGSMSLRAQTTPRKSGVQRLSQLVSRLPQRAEPRGNVGIAASSPAFVLPADSSLFLDNDDDGETSYGDQFIIYGPLKNQSSGRIVGSYEGTLTITNDTTFFANLTLLFPRSGTVTIAGAPYPDGARSDVFLAPLVGTTGSVRTGSQAGFFNNRKGELGVVLNAR